MGLLDDAIREHLELKRQRGAEADEVARLEREALGPVVRGDELAAHAEPADAAPFSSEYGAGEPDHGSEHQQPFEPAPDEHLTAPDPVAEPPLEHQPTEEFDVESAHAQAHEEPQPPADPAAPHPPAPGEHDVLEETPEFLQETPEHDRLWFEQAPPQEFDFDK